MAFSDLHNELILLIGQFLPDERDLSALTRTNRRLFHLLTSLLIRHNIQHHGASGLEKTLRLPSEPKGRWSREDEEDLREYYNPSVPITPDGLPTAVTPDILARDAVIRRFKEHGASFDDEDDPVCTALANAAFNRQEAIFFLLVRNGLDCTSSSGGQVTLLHAAAWGGSVRILRFLIEEKGLDVHVREEYMKTPMHYAAGGGHEGAIRLLADHGAEIDPRDVEGLTPLHVLLVETQPAPGGWRCPVLRALIELGARLDARTDNGETGLHIAVLHLHNHPLDVDTIMAHAADLDLEGRRSGGETPLYYAIRKNLTLWARALVEHGADVNTRNDEGFSALYAAAESSEKQELLPLLVEKGANLTTDIGNGMNILQYLDYKNESHEILYTNKQPEK